ncbi:hypothetical protein [Skermania piniformis]|uniref:Uncharacterized protein n=1 Tax=Skermania pinensis TaxID=39122 RepID=A0ABX8S5W6_9ACTN|nr:hypothetical protein [Skermania piniformis]QXQ13123.1 hypothetical protein KV203_14680 [Skermania piniformis]
MSLIRGLSGAVAAGVVVLAIVVVATAFVADARQFPGPGWASITWHVIAAVVVIGCQLIADRRSGVRTLLPVVAVFGVTLLLLWTQWWGG